MYQPQNSQGNQQPPQQQPGQPYPQQPPSYPEVKPLPKGWQQPINVQPANQQQVPPPAYYQQPPQYNPNGFYGSAPVPVKQWPSWATALLVIGAIFIVAILGIVFSSNSKTSTTTTPNSQQAIATAGPTQRVAQAAATTVPTLQVGKVGETIALNGYTITVNGVEKSENFDPSSDYGKVKDGFIFVAVDITVGSNKAKGVTSTPAYAVLKDSDGFKYDQPFSGYKKPSLPGENDLAVGDKARGWVTFEVTKTAKGLVLEYGQLFESEKIRVALS